MTNNESIRINEELLKSFRRVLFYSDYKEHMELVDRMRSKVSVNIAKTTYPHEKPYQGVHGCYEL